jgi:hypothetical protein
MLYNSRGGTTHWCRMQKLACCTTGSRYQYIVIWWEWYYQIFSVLQRRLQCSWMINGEFLSIKIFTGYVWYNTNHAKLVIFQGQCWSVEDAMNEKMMATKCPSRKLQMITFNIQPKHSYVNSIHFHFLLNLSFLYQFFLLKSKYFTSSV